MKVTTTSKRVLCFALCTLPFLFILGWLFREFPGKMDGPDVVIIGDSALINHFSNGRLYGGLVTVDQESGGPFVERIREGFESFGAQKKGSFSWSMYLPNRVFNG